MDLKGKRVPRSMSRPRWWMESRTDALEVARDGEARDQLIALNRENPLAVDKRFLGIKAELEDATRDHKAL